MRRGHSFETAVQVNTPCEFRDMHICLFGRKPYYSLPHQWELPKMMWIDEEGREAYISKKEYDLRKEAMKQRCNVIMLDSETFEPIESRF